MNTLCLIVAVAALLTLPAAAQDHRFEVDPRRECARTSLPV